MINAALLQLEALTTYYVYEVGGVWPTRATATTNSASRVVWVGPDEPPIGGSYAIGNDRWEQLT